ncbi:MAG: glycosyltransferase family 4 protein [Solirubrobacterales bacterium]|nr:glycosyltransferase family 4 protein [Solirubrobacterales bacterium]
MQVAFVVNDLQLSGGVGVVVQHARQLATRHGMDVSLVLAREQEDPHWQELAQLHVLSLDDAREREFDLVVHTWWETAYAAFQLRGGRHVAFVQSLEDRFYRPDEPDRLAAAITLDLPVAFVTEATWIQEAIADLRPDATCHLVRNGIDKDVFPAVDAVPEHDGPLRILVEGYASTWFKGVNDAIAATRDMAEPHHLTVVAPDRTGLDATGADRVLGPVPSSEMAALYGEADVVLKLSRVEGMYGPPLEGFHRGATCVTTEVTGSEMYIEHGVNALVVDWDDLRGTARQLDLLAKDRELLLRLREGALATARAWPSWEDAGAEMAAALQAIAGAPPPSPYAHVARLLGDLRSGTEQQRLFMVERRDLQRQVRQLERIKALPGIRHYRRAKASRPVRLALRVARPAKQKLLGPGS